MNALLAKFAPWIGLGLIVALGLTFWAGHRHGYAARQTEYDLADAAAKDTARKTLTGMEKGYEKTSSSIRKAPDGGCVGPASGSSSDWLRNAYKGQ
jgi:hypothetical protein